MCIQRIQMFHQKTNLQIKQTEQQIAKLLDEHKDENARIRIEGVIRQKNTVKATEIISLMAELLIQRIQLIERQAACSPDLIEAVASIIYCADRIAEIPELREITQQFALKYTKEWCITHMNNESNCVSKRIIQLLSLKPPEMKIVISALQNLAEENGITWSPGDSLAEDDQQIGAIVPLVSAELPPPQPIPIAVLSGEDEVAMGNAFAQQQGMGGGYTPFPTPITTLPPAPQPQHIPPTNYMPTDYPGIFRVIVHKTANLVSGGQAVQHPFVKLHMAEQPLQTTPVDHAGGVEPNWTQVYDFKVSGPGSILNVEVLNQDRVGDVAVGGTVVQVDSNKNSERTAAWIPLTSRFNNDQVGSILLSLQYLTALQVQNPENIYTPQTQEFKQPYQQPQPDLGFGGAEKQPENTNDFFNPNAVDPNGDNNDDDGEDGGAPDFDELERRFQALRG
jgi:hypothetical protein